MTLVTNVEIEQTDVLIFGMRNLENLTPKDQGTLKNKHSTHTAGLLHGCAASARGTICQRVVLCAPVCMFIAGGPGPPAECGGIRVNGKGMHLRAINPLAH